MKRFLKHAVIGLFLTLVIIVSASAEGFVIDDYAVIVNLYTKAVDDPYYALDQFRSLVEYYTETSERKVALDQYNDASLYYHYAQGRIDLEDGNYESAINGHFDVIGAFGSNTEYYKQFAEGMVQKEYGNYAAAIEHFSKVIALPWLSAVGVQEIASCKALYRDDLLMKGDTACGNGDHVKAQELFLILMNLPDKTGKLKYDACVQHSTSQEEQQTSIEITSVRAHSANAVYIDWASNAEHFIITWNCDLTNQLPAQQASTNENFITVEGLLPGTDYLFRVIDGNNEMVYATAIAKTAAADPYTEADCLANSMYRYNVEQYQISGSPISDRFRMTGAADVVENGELYVYSPTIRESGAFVLLSMLKSIDEMNEKPYTLLLHIDTLGTLSVNGVLGDESTLIDKSRLFVIIGPLVNHAVTQYPSLEGKGYVIDVLVDNLFLTSINGIFR